MRQIRTTVILIILIIGMVGLGLWFERHPFLETEPVPTATPEPRPSPTYKAFSPMNTVAVRPTGTPVPPQEEIKPIGKEEAEVITRVYTAEEGNIYTFNYSPDNGELPSVLQALEDLSAPAVFFMKDDDLRQFPQDASLIIQAGHEMGILMEKDSQITAERQLAMIQESEKELRALGYTGEVYVRTAYGEPSTTHRQVAAAGGYKLISFLQDMVPNTVSRLSDASQILSTIFSGNNDVALQRGEIVTFQMGLFQYSNTVLANYIRLLTNKKNIYPVKSLSAMMNNTAMCYTYPLTDDQILPSVLNQIYPGHITADQDPMDVILERYYGTNWVVKEDFLPGFKPMERYYLNTSGYIRNKENHCFLTFDDWGPDETLTKLLKVLEKHRVKATFFIRTNYITYNPNLVRAIAMAGHTIASHTDSHFPLSNNVKDGVVFESLTEKQAKELQEDLILSYEKLQRIVGDIEIDGKPALSRLFRPPTLAVSKIGLTTVFDCGFTYSVSGSFSTEDYRAKSAEALCDAILEKVWSGCVLVMHMSQNSIYTADAVDMFLTKLEQQGSPLKFVSLLEDLS